MEEFVQQFYDASPDVPPTIVVQHPVVDAAAVEAIARRDGSDYVLSGVKKFVPDGTTDLQRNIDKKYIEPEEGDGLNIRGIGRPEWQAGNLHNYMEMLSIYHQLTPPRYIREGDKDPETAVITRRLTRELDLSAWFTRPCLIIIGYLDASETPVPILVDGKTPRSEGLTVVRWIYPLPLVETEIVADPVPRRRR